MLCFIKKNKKYKKNKWGSVWAASRHCQAQGFPFSINQSFGLGLVITAFDTTASIYHTRTCKRK